MVIDFHVHIFPDKLAPRAVDSLSKRAKIPAYTDGTLGGTIKKMEKAGVSLAVVQSIATNIKQTQNVNNFAIEADKNEKIVAFGSIHPDDESYKDELLRLKEEGIKGIKLHPDYQNFFIDDPKMQPVYEDILKNDFILLFHTGLDYGLPDPVHATPERMSHTLSMFEGEKVCFAHMGGFNMHDDAEKYIYGHNVYIDTSCVGEFVGKEKLKELILAHRPDRILFATDSPWNSFASAIEIISSLDLDEKLKEMIFAGNAKLLLGIE